LNTPQYELKAAPMVAFTTVLMIESASEDACAPHRPFSPESAAIKFCAELIFFFGASACFRETRAVHWNRRISYGVHKEQCLSEPNLAKRDSNRRISIGYARARNEKFDITFSELFTKRRSLLMSDLIVFAYSCQGPLDGSGRLRI
jgi:hypothetical protein